MKGGIRMSRLRRFLTAIGVLACVMVLLAGPAFAATSGTVYGKAVLAPYAIVVSGHGSDSGDPLIFEGLRGQNVWEKFNSQFTVTNTGTQAATIKCDVGQLPTDGVSTWDLSDWSGTGDESAAWMLYDGFNEHSSFVVPNTHANYASYSVMDSLLASGDSDTFSSSFEFPSSTASVADHNMSATISVVAP